MIRSAFDKLNNPGIVEKLIHEMFHAAGLRGSQPYRSEFWRNNDLLDTVRGNEMGKQASAVKQTLRYLTEPRTLLVIYAVVDLSWTWVRVQRATAEMVAAYINPLRSPLSMMADSFLLLISVLGLRLGRLWSYLAAIAAGGWLLYRGLDKWQLIASGTELPMWSWSVLNYWFEYSEGWWDFPRFVVAVFVVAYGTMVLSRYSKRDSLGDRNPRASR